MYTQGKKDFENVPIVIIASVQEEDDVNVSGEVNVGDH